MIGPAGDHALDVLEFGDVLDLIASGALGQEGRARVRRLHPLATREAALGELRAVDEVRGLLGGEEGFDPGTIPDARATLDRLAIDGAVLAPEAIVACGGLLAAGRRASSALDGRVSEGGLVHALYERLWTNRELEERIERTFDETGEVSDNASPELRRLRRQLQDRRSRLVGRLEEYSRSLPDRIRVSDGSVTLRGGRYCIPVRREGKRAVGGLVHDASGSRQTLFVEPAIAIDAMNEIRELEIAVQREIDRILAELTAALHGNVGDLSESYDALCTLDSIRARALFAARLDCARPELTDASEAIRIRGGRHPLLAARGDVVPFDLDLAADERVLLISGPNAGGKTVLLKSVGLISALARSGVIPPVGRGTRLPFLGGPFAIIGDEQSIEASLSTFGAQAKNLAEILTEAGRDDLVLIDEIGSATDPAEGGALAAATLAALAEQVRLTIATTHLGDLKGLAEESPGTVNASLQFDSDRLEPTYRLEKNRPGRSYALEIAARLGVPSHVLEDARSRLDTDHRSLDGLLARLEADQAEVDRLRSDLEETQASIAAEVARVAARSEELARRDRELEREAEKRLEEVLRDARAEVEAAIARLEKEYAASPAGEANLKEARRATRDIVERGLRESRARQAAVAGGQDAGGVDFAVGDRVTWSGGGRAGTLVELRGDRGVVEVDGVRLTLPSSDLSAAPEAKGRGSPPGSTRREERRERRPEFNVTTEIDLRGLRVEEVEAALTPALDAAVVAELPWLRVIHGKGTGALRKIVQALLDRDPRVSEHASGDVREGGSGVTVVKFR